VQSTRLQTLKYSSSNDGAKREREREAAWLLKAITMLDLCMIFGHHSEAEETTSRQNFYILLGYRK
jgi:hypothetical protein